MKRVEIEVIRGTEDDGTRLKRVLEILAEGTFAYLEENGYFREEKEGKGLIEGDRRGMFIVGKQQSGDWIQSKSH